LQGIPLIYEVIIVEVEGGSFKTSMQNKAVFYFHFDIFIFVNKVAGEKMQFAQKPPAVECPAFYVLLHQCTVKSVLTLGLSSNNLLKFDSCECQKVSTAQ
jgi:hypothetical protein